MGDEEEVYGSSYETENQREEGEDVSGFKCGAGPEGQSAVFPRSLPLSSPPSLAQSC